MTNASNLAGLATSINPNVDLVVGVLAATTYSGDGTGLTGSGLGTTGGVSTSGIIASTNAAKIPGTSWGIVGGGNHSLVTQKI